MLKPEPAPELVPDEWSERDRVFRGWRGLALGLGCVWVMTFAVESFGWNGWLVSSLGVFGLLFWPDLRRAPRRQRR